MTEHATTPFGADVVNWRSGVETGATVSVGRGPSAAPEAA